jgi:hypothetical protein
VRRLASSAVHKVESAGEKSAAWRKAILFAMVVAGTAALAQQMGGELVLMGAVIFVLLGDRVKVHSLVIGDLGPVRMSLPLWEMVTMESVKWASHPLLQN